MKSFKTYGFYNGFGTCGHCILASFLPLDHQKTWTWKLSPTLQAQSTENHDIIFKMDPRRLPKSNLKSIKIDIWASMCLLGAPLGPRITKMVPQGTQKGTSEVTKIIDFRRKSDPIQQPTCHAQCVLMTIRLPPPGRVVSTLAPPGYP